MTVIQDVHYDGVVGYGSIRDTYKIAKTQDPRINLNDVTGVLNEIEERQIKTTVTGTNSFVSPHPLLEIEIDLIDTGTKIKQPMYRYGVVGIATSPTRHGFIRSRTKALKS